VAAGRQGLTRAAERVRWACRDGREQRRGGEQQLPDDAGALHGLRSARERRDVERSWAVGAQPEKGRRLTSSAPELQRMTRSSRVSWERALPMLVLLLLLRTRCHLLQGTALIDCMLASGCAALRCAIVRVRALRCDARLPPVGCSCQNRTETDIGTLGAVLMQCALLSCSSQDAATGSLPQVPQPWEAGHLGRLAGAPDAVHSLGQGVARLTASSAHGRSWGLGSHPQASNSASTGPTFPRIQLLVTRPALTTACS
jgi:hypothetical protein